jgi:hypothetical protein
MAELENEWMQYLTMQHTEKTTGFSSETTHIKRVCNDIDGPSIGKINHDMELFISTKTKVLFLNHIVDIHNLFWNLLYIFFKLLIFNFWNNFIKFKN